MKKTIIGYLGDLGRYVRFIYFDILSGTPKNTHDAYECIIQIFFTGILTTFIIIPSSLFIGGVLALQGHYVLSMFGGETQLGQLVALSTFRELGPVVTALLYAGRTGSSITSEVSIMQLTDQLRALESIGIPTKSYIMFPRFISGLVSLPILTIFFNAFTLVGSHIIAIHWLGMDMGFFWIDIQNNVNFSIDLIPGLIKSLCFAIIIHTIALYHGKHSDKSASGIAVATTTTVVQSSISILVADFFLTIIFMGVWK